MKQTEMVLKWLKEVGPITPLDALREFGLMRLGARIFDLRRQGYNIETKTETRVNRFGRKVSYARYELKGEANEDQR